MLSIDSNCVWRLRDERLDQARGDTGHLYLAGRPYLRSTRPYRGVRPDADQSEHRLEGRPILAVLITPGSARASVIINLIREGEHLQFESTTRTAGRIGPGMSSGPMRLPIAVDDG
jgi:hypothetical protein